MGNWGTSSNALRWKTRNIRLFYQARPAHPRTIIRRHYTAACTVPVRELTHSGLTSLSLAPGSMQLYDSWPEGFRAHATVGWRVQHRRP